MLYVFHSIYPMSTAVNVTRLFFIFILVSYLHAQQTICEEEIEIGTTHVNAVFVAYWSGEVGFTYNNGVLITPKHVLTTAQFLSQRKCGRNLTTRKYECIPADPSEYEVVFGKAYIVGTGGTHIKYGKAIHIHPKYKNDLNYGIGILILQEDHKKKVYPFRISFGGYVSFYMDEFENCLIYTYGQSSCSRTFTKSVKKNWYSFKSGQNFQRLQRIIISSIDVNKREKMCNDILKKHAEADMALNRDKLVCATANFTSDDCQNFGGSGLFCNDKLKGFVLQPMNCHYENLPILFIPIQEFKHWMYKIQGRED